MKRLYSILCLAILFGVYSNQALNADSWVSNGPYGGVITSIAVDPQDSQTIYVTTFGGGVFKTINGGVSWDPVNEGLASLDIRCLFITPDNSGHLYLASAEGIYHSLDGGANWQKKDRGLGTPDVRFIALARTNPELLYAAGYNGVYKSEDSGNNWSLSLNTPDVRSIAIDPRNPEIVYAATWGGIYKTISGGTKWDKLNGELSRDKVWSVTIDPLDSKTVYIGLDKGGIYKTSDGGENWTSQNLGLTDNDIRCLVIDITAGVEYVGTFGGGVYKRQRGKETWQPINTGLSNTKVRSLSLDSDFIYVGTNGGGIFKSNNGGLSWEEINKGITNTYVQALTAGDGGILYAGIDFGGGVYKSSDGGKSWEARSEGIMNNTLEDLLAVPDNTEVVYAGTYSQGAFRTLNGGGEWSQINEGLLDLSVWSLAASSTTLYAGTGGKGVFASTNGGNNWNPANQGMDGAGIHALAVDPGDEKIIYAGGFSGVFRSDDGGATWTGKNTGLSNTDVRALDITSDGILYLGTYGGGVFQSSDRGETWKEINTGLSKRSILSLAIDQDNERTIYAGTYEGGVFRSQDGGIAWTQLTQDGLVSPSIMSLVVSGGRVFAGTRGGGVVEYVETPADSTPPGAIIDLTAADPTLHTITLAWTAPGDDDRVGQAAAYDLRYSTSRAAIETWTEATQVEDEPTPRVSGAAEVFVVAGLDPETTYYFAIKTLDEAENVSLRSNIASETTLRLADTTSPCRITDLIAGNPTTHSVTLSWTAPGDDCQEGQASCYDIRYSTSLINEDNWAAAIQVEDNPRPALPGSKEAFGVEGLDPRTLYYFALKACDEEGNLSPLSNVVSETTLGANRPPQVTLTYPVGGEILRGVAEICWQATDPDGDDLSIDLFVKRYSDLSWMGLALGKANNGECYPWDTTSFKDGEDYLIKVAANDGQLSGEDHTQTTFAISNQPPIIGPAADLRDALVYPVPYQPSEAYNGALKFIHLTETSRVGIYTLTGELVRKLPKRDLGPIPYANAYGLTWDSFNQWGEAAAAGIYIYVIADEAGHQKTGKFSLLR
ncbi:MAG: hypothetical protein AB1797_10680 [bacterium]